MEALFLSDVYVMAAIQAQSFVASHPLSVVLVLHPSSSDKRTLISVRFSYLPALHLVTAQAQDAADNVYLANLIPEDTGAVTPNEANNQLQGGTFKFDMGRPDRPYRSSSYCPGLWAQHLAGLDFLPAVPAAATGA
eukprot:scaffold19896_cov16-Prasinocladus_malaysianus.AAC.1